MRAVHLISRTGQALVVAAALLTITACPAKLAPYDYPSEPDPRNKDLVLGVGDVIAINVWENASFNTEGAIRPDGTITMPLIGDLKAAGETPASLKVKINKQLQNYLKGVQGTEITVAVKAYKSYRFTIQGEVGKTGVFSSEQFVRVSDALALAGGLTRFAKRNGIILMRNNAKGEMRRIPLDYDALASGQRPDMNIFVLPGDTIWVP